MDVFWIEATPWDYAAGAAVTVRACNTDLSLVTRHGNIEWIPVVDGGPSFSTTVFQGTFSGSADTTRGQLDLVAELGDVDDWGTYAWQSRPLKIWSGTIDTSDPVSPSIGSKTLLFDGQSESFDPDGATIHLRTARPIGLLAKDSYLGSGGAEGTAGLLGVKKPYSIGKQINRPPVLINAGKVMYQANGAGRLIELLGIRENGILLDQPVTFHASFVDLFNATVPATEFHVHLASGSFRLGFTPQGNITCDYKGANTGATYPATLSALILQLLAQSGWDVSTKIDAGSFAYLDTVYTTAECQFHDESGTDVASALTAVMSGCGGYWDVDQLGVLYVGLFVQEETEDFSVGDEGVGDYDLLGSDFLPTRAPFCRNRLGYAFNSQVMDFGDTYLPALFDLNSPDTWSYAGGATYHTFGGTDRPADTNAVEMLATGAQVYWGRAAPCVPEETLFFNHAVRASGTFGDTADNIRGGVIFYGADGEPRAVQSVFDLPGSAISAAECAGVWVTRGTSIVTPTGVASAVPFSIRAGTGTGGALYAAEPRFGRTQPGADVTATNQSGLGDVADIHISADYTGAVDSGQLPRDVSVTRLLGASDVSDYTTFTVSATGGVTVTVDSVGDPLPGTVTIPSQALPPETTVTVMTDYLGVQLPKSFKVLRDDAGIPPSSGGGGGGGGGTPGTPASLSSFTAPLSSGSYVVMATFADITTGSGGKVDVVFGLNFDAQFSQGNIDPTSIDPDGTFLDVLIEYSTNGGSSWTAAGAAGGATSEAYKYFRITPPKGVVQGAGYSTLSRSISGLGSGTTVRVRLSGIQAPGSTGSPHGVASVYGSATATPS